MMMRRNGLIGNGKTDGRDFIGRDAMLACAHADDHWNMELLEFDAPEFDPFYMHTVFRGNSAIGLVTSGGYGHRLQKTIGLAYFRKNVAAGDELKVEILGRSSKARTIQPL
jgi:dimethylglycine dehydrogenase